MLSGLAIWIVTKVGGFAADKGFRKLETFTATFIRGRRDIHPKTENLASHLEACATAALQIQCEFEKIVRSLYWASQDDRMVVGAIGRHYKPHGKSSYIVKEYTSFFSDKCMIFASATRKLNEQITIALECDTEVWNEALRDCLKPIIEEAITLLRPSWGCPETIDESWRIVAQAVEEQSTNQLELLKRLDAIWTPQIFTDETFEKSSWQPGHVGWSPERAQELMSKLRTRLLETFLPALYLSVPQPSPANPSAGEAAEIAFSAEREWEIEYRPNLEDEFEDDRYDIPYEIENRSFATVFCRPNEVDGYIVLGLPILAALAEFCALDRSWNERDFRHIALLSGKSRMRTRIFPMDHYTWVGQGS